MRYFTLALLAAQQAFAHTGFSNFYVNGVDQGEAICVRMSKNLGPQVWNWPITNLASNDFACGYNGTVGVNRVCGAPDGAALTFEWRETPWQPGGGAMDPSHKGPCSVCVFVSLLSIMVLI
jgi:Auxiliary Activity family 9 (formerly GH61)